MLVVFLPQLRNFINAGLVSPYFVILFGRSNTARMRSIFFFLAACIPSTFAYSLVKDYMKGNFYDDFSFWIDADPTNGFGT